MAPSNFVRPPESGKYAFARSLGCLVVGTKDGTGGAEQETDMFDSVNAGWMLQKI